MATLMTKIKPGSWQCNLCNKSEALYAQPENKGYNNLYSHILLSHPKWEELYAALNKQQNLTFAICPKVKNAYGWLKRVAVYGNPISSCEDDNELEYCTLSKISYKTFMTYLSAVSESVEKTLSQKMPDKICIIFDAWTENGTHYVAILASWTMDDNCTKTCLLAFTPLLDETAWTAKNYKHLFEVVLEMYGKTIDNVVCIVGDNCATNKKIATILDLPLVGCASHKLNLAIEKYMLGNDLIMRINNLMQLLNKPLKLAVLRKRTPLKPIHKNATRWTSTFEMVQRFLSIKEFIDLSDEEILALYPSHQQISQISSLNVTLQKFYQATLFLQRRDVTLLDARLLFDRIIAHHPEMKEYLSDDAAITHNSNFDSGICKILGGKLDDMSAKEVLACSRLQVSGSQKLCNEEEDDDGFIPKRVANGSSKYLDLRFIPPTSNDAERLFSVASRYYSDVRQRMEPTTLEKLLFLRYNEHFWDIHTVEKAIK